MSDNPKMKIELQELIDTEKPTKGYVDAMCRDAINEIERLEKEVADLVHDLVRKDKALLEYEELHK